MPSSSELLKDSDAHSSEHSKYKDQLNSVSFDAINPPLLSTFALETICALISTAGTRCQINLLFALIETHQITTPLKQC